MIPAHNAGSDETYDSGRFMESVRTITHLFLELELMSMSYWQDRLKLTRTVHFRRQLRL